MTNRIVRIVVFGVCGLTACKGKEPVDPGLPGPPSQVIEVTPASRSALANATVSSTITVAVTDASGRGIAGQVVSFAVFAGGGSLTGGLSDTTDANGHATAPSWRLGKRADGPSAQKLRATSGSLPPLDISATVLTSYAITVRFFGTAMTPQQQDLFTAAAQRIMGVVTGDLLSVTLSGTDVSSCLDQPANTTVLTETIDDIVIYAQAKAIDGPGQVLGSAGPCFIRSGAGCAAGCDKIPLMGVMSFDIADLNSSGFQNVITHEMLHVLGLGSLWRPDYFNFISGAGTLDPRYTAAEALAACVAVGGTISCNSTVPAEGCADHPECQATIEEPTKGAGTRDSHWREQTFGPELMTGFLNAGTNPFSAVSIAGLKDMGYVVNEGDNDAYTIFLGSLRANAVAAPVASPFSPNWEGEHRAPLYSIDRGGNIRLLRKGQ